MGVISDKELLAQLEQKQRQLCAQEQRHRNQAMIVARVVVLLGLFVMGVTYWSIV